MTKRFKKVRFYDVRDEKWRSLYGPACVVKSNYGELIYRAFFKGEIRSNYPHLVSQQSP